MDAKISVLAKAWSLPVEQDFKLAIVQFPANFLIELDEYPPGATPRPRRPGELPPGMSMVSFAVDSLDAIDLEFLSPPRRIESAPYNGRRTVVARGAAGEYIELVEGIAPAR
jgi:hypothetical protein